MFFIPFDNWKRLVFMQIYQYFVVWYNRLFAAFFETSLLKVVRILYTLSLL